MTKTHFPLFFIIVILVLGAVLFSAPFLRYPYDMFHHLIVIDDLYTQLSHPIEKFTNVMSGGNCVLIPTGETEPIVLQRGRYIWHYLWAWVFYLLHIDGSEIFLRAKIIHLTQVYLSLFALYYFSNVAIRNVLPHLTKEALRWLSLWAVVIWVTIFATTSGYHQVWLMWYSINYQITLPLFWYMLGLTIVLLLEERSRKIKLFFALQIIFLSRFIIQTHSMEFLYYLMHIGVFVLVFADKVYLFAKRYFYLFVPLIALSYYLVTHYLYEKPRLFEYLSWEKLPELYTRIMHDGAYLVSGYKLNRAYASINELMYVILAYGIIAIGYLWWRHSRSQPVHIHYRPLLYLILTSLFVLIPLYRFSGGLFGLITHIAVVNRIYYSASLFVLLPIFAYLLLQHKRIVWTNLLILLTLIATAIFSKHSDLVRHNYYKNLQSIKYSFKGTKIHFNLTDTQIDTIRRKVLSYEQHNHTLKPIRFYARADIAFVIKYICRKEVYWEGRRANPDPRKAYETHKGERSHHHILFEIPKGFPAYHPYQ